VGELLEPPEIHGGQLDLDLRDAEGGDLENAVRDPARVAAESVDGDNLRASEDRMVAEGDREHHGAFLRGGLPVRLLAGLVELAQQGGAASPGPGIRRRTHSTCRRARP
jgi:hypothetical protein